MKDKSYSKIFILFFLCVTLPLRAEQPHRLFDQCPKLIPSLKGNISVEVKKFGDNQNRYYYTVQNTSGPDAIDSVWLIGAEDVGSYERPENWLMLTRMGLAEWFPVTPYSGKHEILGTSPPSDAAILPNSKKEGFVMVSKLRPGLLLYRLGARREIDLEMANFMNWFRQNVAMDSLSYENYEEAIDEEYGQACGGSQADDPRLTVSGVIVGPSPYATATSVLVPSLSKADLVFEMIPEVGSEKLIGTSSKVSFYNADSGKMIPVSSTYQIGPSGRPALIVTVRRFVVEQYSCRAQSVLAEISTEGKTVMRSKIIGTDLGLPSICTR